MNEEDHREKEQAMALTWDVREITNHEVVTTDPDDENKWSPVTERLVWLTMFTGIGWQITDDNIDEFIGRVRLFEKMFGAGMSYLNEETNEWEPHFITEEEIRAHKGLRTNVSFEDRETWLSRQVDMEFFRSVTHPDRQCMSCGEATTGIRLTRSAPGGSFSLLCRDCDVRF